MDELSEEDKLKVARARKIERFLSQPFQVKTLQQNTILYKTTKWILFQDEKGLLLWQNCAIYFRQITGFRLNYLSVLFLIFDFIYYFDIFLFAQVAEVFTNNPGKLVPIEQTISGFKEILEGKYDHLPEVAFYMVGNIEEVVTKAERLAAEAS